LEKCVTHFADRLITAVRTKGNALCVGLDPRWEALPRAIRTRHGEENLESMAAGFEEFCLRVIDVVAPLVSVVKLQSAFFEACGPAGFSAQQRILRAARTHGLITILDAKRNDIAATAAAYADAAFAGIPLAGRAHPVWDVDALTVNPYLGRDSVEPFLQRARASGRGVFLLVRTSNPGAPQFQDLDCGGRPVFLHVAEAVRQWTCEHLGACGFGDVGAVVGATFPAELRRLREWLPEAILLVPGFGVQGGAAVDVAGAFRDDGLGALVNSSRGIICSFDPDERAWEQAVEDATRAAIRALAEATPMGRLVNPSQSAP
jgi:orotidine-5'-phosphate decarboxylase